MINLISRHALPQSNGLGRGPAKVFHNLVRGLDAIGYPYIINADVRASRRLWIHDWPQALRLLPVRGVRTVVGPNIWVEPAEIEDPTRLNNALLLQPCEWAKRFWLGSGFEACPIAVWPVGVDTEAFPRRESPPRLNALVYHKHRDPRELAIIVQVLADEGIPFSILVYGEYEEDEYKAALAEASFVVWHGRHESQGLALEEALSSDVPVLVCDVQWLTDARTGMRRFDASVRIPVTAAPYFDDRCGLVVSGMGGFRNALQALVDRLPGFEPREFILQNLSLCSQAQAFVALWEGWGMTVDEGRLETADLNRPFSIPLRARFEGAIRRRMTRVLR